MHWSIEVSGGFVLRAAVSALTVVLLLAHAGLGCCAHHEHACGQTHGHLALIGEHVCADSIHEHPAVTHGQSGHPHEGPDDCQGSKCVLGRPQDEQVGKSAIFVADLTGPSSEAAQGTLEGRLERAPGANDVWLPVRLHLVHQVLLI